MFGISMWEVVLILVVALIVLGPKQLVETAKVAGRVYREILRMTGDLRSSIDLDNLSYHERREPTSYQPPSSSIHSGKDKDAIPPEDARSGPDFYADLLESSKDEPQQSKPDADVAASEMNTEARAQEPLKTATKE